MIQMTSFQCADSIRRIYLNLDLLVTIYFKRNPVTSKEVIYAVFVNGIEYELENTEDNREKLGIE